MPAGTGEAGGVGWSEGSRWTAHSARGGAHGATRGDIGHALCPAALRSVLNRSVPDATGPRTEVAATEDEAFALKLGPAPVRGAAGTPQGRYQTRIEAEGALWGPGAGRPAGRRL